MKGIKGMTNKLPDYPRTSGLVMRQLRGWNSGGPAAASHWCVIRAGPPEFAGQGPAGATRPREAMPGRNEAPWNSGFPVSLW